MKTKLPFKIGIIAFFVMMLYSINISAHGVQTAYCLQDNGFIRVYVEHWHGDLPSNFMDGQVEIITQYGTTISTQWLSPDGVINSTTINDLSDCGSAITVLSQCSDANAMNDWVYYDFPPEVFDVLVSITLNGGNNIFFTESCDALYPSSPILETFVDTYGPAITAPDINVESCGENVEFNASIIDNRDPNPTFTYSIASGSFFGVGSTAVTVNALDDLNNASSKTFYVNVSPPVPNIQVTLASGTNKICEDGSGIINATSINGATYAWTGPNGFASNQQNPSITDVGIYNVTITIQDACTYYAYGSLEVGYSNIAVSVESTNPTCADNSDGSVTAFKTDNIGISYASGGNTNPNLYSIKKSTGATTVIGDMGIGGVPAIAINSSGKLFASNSYQLFEIDPVTAASTLIGQMVGRCSNVPALAFDDQDVLYAWDHCGYFFTVDTSTGAMTLIGTTGISMSGMQFDPTDGSLWATDRNNIYKVNKSTGTLTNIGYTGYSQISDLVFEGNGNLFASRGGGGNNQYLSINKTTGAGTLVANTVSNISGMTCNNGPGGITYLWNTGAITKTISGLPAGNYSVTVTNGLGCTATASVTLQDPPALEVNAGEAQTICDTPAQLNAIGNPNGAPVDASSTQYVLFDAQGGSGNFTYDLCFDGYDWLYQTTYSQNIEAIIAGLDFKLYFTCSVVTFTFKINGNVLGTYVDPGLACNCDAGNYGTYPKTVSFTQAEVAALSVAGSNTVSVEMSAPNGTALAGILAEVLTAGETYSWSPSTGLSDANIANPEALPSETTTYTVTYTTGNGCSVSSDVVVMVQCNLPPVAVCQDIEVPADANCEGTAVAADFDGGSSDPDGDDITFSISPEGPYALGETEVTLTVTDPFGETSTCISKITVTNVLPYNNPVTEGIVVSSIDPIQAGTEFSLSADFNDDNITSATWYFISDGVLNISEDLEDPITEDISNQGVVSGTFNFDASNTGVYTIKVVVVDACGETAEASYDFVVIYDPNGGFVTGGGWIISPSGALVGTTTKGSANFGFVAKYKSGKNSANEVDGNTNFQFKEGDFHFKSSMHTAMSLVISGERKATYRGSGTVNGSGVYDFMVSVIDGEAPGAGPDDYDSFRIKVWHSGSPTSVVYDNEIAKAENADAITGLGGGSIVIHKPKGGGKSKGDNSIDEASFDGFKLAAWPNPSNNTFSLKLKSNNTVEKIEIHVFDIQGRQVYSTVGSPNQEYSIGSSFQFGLYFVKVIQGKASQQVKLIKY